MRKCKNKYLYYGKRLSTSRYENRRLAFNEAPPPRPGLRLPLVGEPEALTWEGGLGREVRRRDSYLEVRAAKAMQTLWAMPLSDDSVDAWRWSIMMMKMVMMMMMMVI